MSTKRRSTATRVAVGLTAGLTLVLAACTSPDNLAAANGADLATTAVVVEIETATVIAGEVIATEVLAPSTPATDLIGNEVTMHRWVPWPEPFERPTAGNTGAQQKAFFGNVGVTLGAERLVAVDIEVCAPASQSEEDGMFLSRFQTIGDQPEQAGIGSLILQPLVFPAFAWPEAGACARGWQGLRWSGSGSPGFQFTSVSRDAANFGARALYQWPELPQAAGADIVDLDALAPGETAEITQGSLAGWTTMVKGWARVPEALGRSSVFGEPYIGAAAGAQLLAVELEVCAGEELTLPGFGLGLDGWNLVGQFRRGTPWSSGFEEIDLPQVGECATGWVAFEAPQELSPTGFFLTDPSDPTAPWLRWALGPDAELDQPVAAGFPGVEGWLASRDECGSAIGSDTSVASELDLALTTDIGLSWLLDDPLPIESGFAVDRLDGSIEIYLADHDATSVGLPVPLRNDQHAVVVRIAADTLDDSELPQVVDASVSMVRGEIGGYLFFDGAEVEITAHTDTTVCGRFVAQAGDSSAEDSLTGTFSAARWHRN